MAVLASILLYRGGRLKRSGSGISLLSWFISCSVERTCFFGWIFISFGLVPLGVIMIMVHSMFVLGQCICFVLAHQRLFLARHQERPANEERIDSWQPTSL